MVLSRKGQTSNVISIIAFILIGLLFLILSYMFLADFTTKTEDVLTGTAATALDKTADFLNLFDFVSIFVFVFYGIVLVGLSTARTNNPVLFLIFLILYLPVIIFSGSVSDMTSQLEDNPSISTYTAQFPLTFLVLNNLPIYCLLIFVLSIFVNFLRVGGGGSF